MFVEKLNKKQQGVYVIEEEKTIVDGKYEGYLNHDNVNHHTISIYTGSKLTGEKVENYFVSTPSETPWKTHLKIFSNSEKIYVVYETAGDQVEADDINLLQDKLVDEINRAITEEKRIDNKLDDEITRSINKDNTLDSKIGSEVSRAITKENSIESKLNSEITRSTNKDNTLDTKIDAEITRSTSRENLIENNLNNYKTSNDSEVSQLKTRTTSLETNKSDKTYVDAELNKKADKSTTYTKVETDARIQNVVGAAPEALDTLQEIAGALNNDKDFAGTMTNELSKKVDKVAGKGLSDENYTATEKVKLAGIAENANNYVHPSTHPASMITEEVNKRFITDTERNNLGDVNSKKHEHNNKSVIDKITQALLDTWNSAVTHISDTIKHITSTERTKWNTVDNKADKTYVDNTFATKQELGNAGYGDMLKSVYDKNNNGKVDNAELADKVPWSGITEKPSTFTPSSHTHTKVDILDTRDIDSPPSFYQTRDIHFEFKRLTTIGITGTAGTYCTVMSDGRWTGSSGGQVTQIVFTDSGKVYCRTSISTITWSAWKELLVKGPLTWNDLKGV